MSSSNIVPLLIASTLVLAAGAGVAIYTGRRTNAAGDWLVAGRSLPLYVIVFTQFATAVGGGVLVAHVGLAYSFGWAYFFYPGFVLLGFLLLSLIATWLRRQEFSTIPEILGRLYARHPVITVLAALASIVVPFGWLATQFVAFASLFSTITGVSTHWLTLIMCAVTLVFVLPGGLRSVAWSDFLLGVVMLVLSLTVAAYVLNMAGGWSGITSSVPDAVTSLPSGLGTAGTTTVLLWLFAIIPGTLTNQLYFQRIFSIRDIGQARKSLVISGLLVLVSGVYAFVIGLSARALNPEFVSGDPEAAPGWLLTQLPTLLLAVYAAFLVATIVSTTGSALQSVTTNVVKDLCVNVLGRSEGPGLVRVSRVVSVVAAILAAALAIAYPTALTWLVATYAYSASILAAPIFIGYWLHRRRGRLEATTAVAGMLGGLVGCTAAHIAGTTVPYAVFGIVSSVIVMLVAHLLNPGRRSEPQGSGVSTTTAGGN
ncbi:sodium:solute symporter family protein [Georgenia alba]|uniref:Sodium:solute symporter n=1 Tax=Georgenia alba TaxID=2233858 RepID=A0ABW2Q2E2_9MICO